jgi:hypothetical protein
MAGPAPTLKTAEIGEVPSMLGTGPIFAREHWTLLRQVETIGQVAGVPRHLLAKLATKELVDNALDTGHAVRFGRIENGIYVENDGPCIPGSNEEIAALFSMNRPLTSTKLLRLPTRGALGNGLRVVAGIVFACHGTLRISTGGRVFRLTPREDGGTTAERVRGKGVVGTRIELTFGDLEYDEDDVLEWAERASLMASYGGDARAYTGKSSPWWYSAGAFFELCHSSQSCTVRDLVRHFDGCSEPKAGKIAAGHKGQPAADLTRDEASSLMETMRRHAKPLKPERLGCVGKLAHLPSAYAKAAVTVETDGSKNPYVIEGWAEVSDEEEILVSVNRTPITAEVFAWYDSKKNQQRIEGCGIDIDVPVGRKPIKFLLNITTSSMPITSDGKAPDMSALEDAIAPLLSKVARRARRAKRDARDPSGKDASLKQQIFEVVPAAFAHASGGIWAGQRQVFYSARDMMDKPDLKWSYFTDVLTDYENEHGDIEGMERDPRGVLIHPHTGEEIALGTRAVKEYERPAYTFNKIVFVEKKGFFSALQQAHWLERHDCALVCSEGFATRAVRDVIDRLGDGDEEIKVFAVHDADAYGTMIMQALQEATKARPARRLKIIDLGLNPEEAIEMGFTPEDQPPRKDGKPHPVADHVSEEWAEWFQSHRFELNKMTTPKFIEWLDEKMAPHDAGKVVPPDEVLTTTLAADVRDGLRAQIAERILRDARLDEQVEDAFRAAGIDIDDITPGLTDDITKALDEAQEQPWTAAVADIAQGIVTKTLGGRK